MMVAGLTVIAERYTLALGNFMVQYDETARLGAYEIGRQALSEGIGLLDLVAVHHLALSTFMAQSAQGINHAWVTRAGEFLDECLGTFEMSQRGYRDAYLELRRLNEVLLQKNEEISRANQELEAFSYSVAHDLRAPLRSIDGFSKILLRDYAGQLDAPGRDYLNLVLQSTQRMARLLEDMLDLARFSRAELRYKPLDLAVLAREAMARLAQQDPKRHYQFVAPQTLPAQGDASLLTAVLDNLLGNAWKYSRPREAARIEFGWSSAEKAYFVRDNGVGFDMAYAGKLFQVFQRLHSVAQFEGTGVGLATVKRIIERHRGRVWAESRVDEGSTFFFTLPEP